MGTSVRGVYTNGFLEKETMKIQGSVLNVRALIGMFHENRKRK